MKPSAYLETTILSYLAARPSRNLVVAAHQSLTLEWWNRRRNRYELLISELVVEEIEKGDRLARSRRTEYAELCKVLSAGPTSLLLAERIVHARCIPKTAAADALHVAVAAIHEVDYLLTWNCSHINNATQKAAIAGVCKSFGYTCPMICTPEELMGDDQ
jgi:hypothetical protein